MHSTIVVIRHGVHHRDAQAVAISCSFKLIGSKSGAIPSLLAALHCQARRRTSSHCIQTERRPRKCSFRTIPHNDCVNVARLPAPCTHPAGVSRSSFLQYGKEVFSRLGNGISSLANESMERSSSEVTLVQCRLPDDVRSDRHSHPAFDAHGAIQPTQAHESSARVGRRQAYKCDYGRRFI